MKEEAVRSVTVKRMAQNRSASLQDLLAVEEPLEIRLQFKEAGQVGFARAAGFNIYSGAQRVR